MQDRGAIGLHDNSRAYKPVAGEAKISLELAFPDQRCKVALWDLEWQRGPAKEITETMRSMRPLRR